MKKYIKRYINSQSGLADHIQVSDEPTHDHVDPEIPDTIPVVIPGEPPVPPLSYSVEEIEIDEVTPMRAREYLDLMNKPKAEQDADPRFIEKKRLKTRPMPKKKKKAKK